MAALGSGVYIGPDCLFSFGSKQLGLFYIPIALLQVAVTFLNSGKLTVLVEDTAVRRWATSEHANPGPGRDVGPEGGYLIPVDSLQPSGHSCTGEGNRKKGAAHSGVSATRNK